MTGDRISMIAGLPLKGMRRTLSIMKRSKISPYSEKEGPANQDGPRAMPTTPMQQTRAPNLGVEASNTEHETTVQRENAISEPHALYRPELEDSGDDTNNAAEEEVGCLNEHLREYFCRRCEGDCRNCLQKEGGGCLCC
ncbi:hypothetical protein BDV26DRAFT_146068 [Aspergillus bertholletiae]|uniref:Uncharacterized protein n=1 Tax=Aspergillus bertholletiae TaxID=1226010 RepID=A0A5N7AMN2_9EURO|nr:hypothetical protein BDV26DRAFT_146068 [Aspergillus bertholletiae]